MKIIKTLLFLFIPLGFLIVFLQHLPSEEGSDEGFKANAENDRCVVSVEAKVVRGSSLEPLFSSGDIVFVEMGRYRCFEPERGDFVIARFAGNEAPLLKRIYGVPGDAFSVKMRNDGEGEILLNGNPARNSSGVIYHFASARAELWRNYERELRGTIPPDFFLILGEFEMGTLDSSQFGFISKKNLLGRVRDP